MANLNDFQVYYCQTNPELPRELGCICGDGELKVDSQRWC